MDSLDLPVWIHNKTCGQDFACFFSSSITVHDVRSALPIGLFTQKSGNFDRSEGKVALPAAFIRIKSNLRLTGVQSVWIT